MPIYNGTSTKNQAAISIGATQMGKVYVGDKLVWQKPSGIFPVKYGLLYNWYTATDIRKISSSDDWVVPIVANILTLRTYLGGSSVAGGAMKEIGTVYWDSPNIGASNSSSLNMRGSGWRNASAGGIFSDFKNTNYSWINNPSPTNTWGNFGASYIQESMLLSSGNSSSEKKYGYSIRLLYIGSGTPTEYVGNDLKRYRIVTIGTQTWLADNLAETKYRNGDSIPEVTDNTAWAALTTGALCAYNNDWNNV